MDKVCRIGTVEIGWKSPVSLFVHIKHENGRLSITGVEGPMTNGDARGSCGQIVGHDWNIAEYAPGWNAEKVAKLREVWDKWHLNNMRPGCEHQRSENWGREQIEVCEYGLTTEAWQLRKATEKRAIDNAANGRPNDFSELERALLGAKLTINRAPDADSPLSGCYEVKKRETKLSGWVYPNQHDRGQLTKPCPACGYEYGSAWLSEPVPADVLAWLESLPAADYAPAWA